MRRLRRADGDAPARTEALRSRLALLLTALEEPVPAADAEGALARRLARGDAADVWCTLAVLRGVLPTHPEVLSAVRLLRADGPAAVLRTLVDRVEPDLDVVLAPRGVLLDVSPVESAVDELGAPLVVEQLVAAWADRDAQHVRWSADGRRLLPAAGAGAADEDDERDEDRTSVVPWRSTFVVLRPPTRQDTASRVTALATWARGATGAVGWGEPAIVANDRTPGEAAAAAAGLSALRHLDVVAAVSGTAREEYEGWLEMVRTLELPGPRLTTVPLPDEAPEADDAQVASWDAAPLPLVVSTGGLGPRGNQLAVLRAANTLWNEGVAFQLLLLGADRPPSDALARQLTRLQEAGLPVGVRSGLDLGGTAALLRSACCLVDVPQHDPLGYHTTLARSLGTPVVAGPHGRSPSPGRDTPVADPDDSTALVGLLRPLVRGHAPGDLTYRAPAPATRTWGAFADELWDALVRPATGPHDPDGVDSPSAFSRRGRTTESLDEGIHEHD